MTEDCGEDGTALCIGADSVCSVCDAEITSSVITGAQLNCYGRQAPLVVGRDGYLHLHDVVVAHIDALTVRGSLRRWSYQGLARARWHWRFKIGPVVRRAFANARVRGGHSNEATKETGT